MKKSHILKSECEKGIATGCPSQGDMCSVCRYIAHETYGTSITALLRAHAHTHTHTHTNTHTHAHTRYQHELQLPDLPEMVFPDSELSLHHETGVGIRFVALDALKCVDHCSDPLKVAVAKRWESTR